MFHVAYSPTPTPRPRPRLLTYADANNEASGSLYLDDEISLAHEDPTKPNFSLRRFRFSNGQLSCSAVGVVAGYAAPNSVERVEIAGQASAPSRVTLSVGGAAPVDLQFFFDASGVVTVKKPDVKVTDDWTITLAPR